MSVAPGNSWRYNLNHLATGERPNCRFSGGLYVAQSSLWFAFLQNELLPGINCLKVSGFLRMPAQFSKHLYM